MPAADRIQRRRGRRQPWQRLTHARLFGGPSCIVRHAAYSSSLDELSKKSNPETEMKWFRGDGRASF